MSAPAPRRPKPVAFQVARHEDGTALQDFLAARLGVSRRAAKQQIDARIVRVDGQCVWMAHHRLRAGAVVTVAGAGASASLTVAVLDAPGRLDFPR